MYNDECHLPGATPLIFGSEEYELIALSFSHDATWVLRPCHPDPPVFLSFFNVFPYFAG